ncbi:MAG TPA: pantoate--beta-alanine ligase [Candidatus Acidoferrum sp.]|nr:pantoate--beta-alanine ligase [Candidatus Acidoferrum sp.]
MRIVSSIAAMQRLAKQWQRTRKRVGFVPTMGYLHAGHLGLVKHTRRAVGKKGIVVVSIYVNPTQFGPQEDFAKYPRDLKRDFKLCREAGADVVFTPNDREMYPRWVESLSSPDQKRHLGPTASRPTHTEFSTYVVEEQLSQSMEGKSRPMHFRGVTTVVAKLFNIVLPDVAALGQKDWQQAAIIRRMTANLNFPVKIIVAPTQRERDGVAMSSRNRYLAGELRRQATVLWCCIQVARATVKKSKSYPAAKLKSALRKLVECEPDARLDYVEFFEPDTLAPIAQVSRGTHMALAVFIGKTRLIDNARL